MKAHTGLWRNSFGYCALLGCKAIDTGISKPQAMKANVYAALMAHQL